MKVKKKEVLEKSIIPYRKLKNINCIHCQRAFHIKDSNRIDTKHMPLLRCCGHSVCDKCVGDPAAISCPKCGVDPISQIPSVNLYAIGLMLAQNSRPAGVPNVTDEEFVFAKSIQSKIDKSSQRCINCEEATTVRCVDCSHYYCDECFKETHSCRALKHHRQVPLNHTEYIPPRFATVCKDHMPNTLKHWCKSCNVKCCSDCVVYDHRTHSTLPILEMNKSCQEEFAAAYEGLVEIIGRVNNAKREVHVALKFPEEEQLNNKVESQINQHFLYLHGILQNLESQMIETLHAETKRRSTNLIEIQKQLQSLETELQDGILLANAAKKKSEYVNHMEIIEKLKELTNVRCYLLKRQVDEEEKEFIKFLADESVVAVIRDHCVVDTKPSAKLYSLVAANELPDDYVIESVARESLSIPLLYDSSAQENTQSVSEDPTTDNDADSVSTKSSNAVETESRKGYQVHAEYIVDPCKFFVRKQSDDHLYEQVQSELEKYDTKADMLPENIIVGKNYVVQGLRHKWFRGRLCRKVKTADNDTTSGSYVFFAIDEGFVFRVNKSKIRCLSSKLVEIPQLVTEHSLSNIIPIDGTSWSTESISEMRHIINEATSLPILYQVDNNKNNVDLLIPTLVHSDPVSLRDALVYLGHGKFECTQKLKNMIPKLSNAYQFEELELNTYYEIVCLRVESPKCFYVRKAEYPEDYFNEMVATMTKVYKSSKKMRTLIYNPVIGLNCAVSYNGAWYRGVISGIPENRKIEVFLVDIGIKSIMNFDKIRKLDACYTSADTRAIKLCLHNAEELNVNPDTKQKMLDFMHPTAKMIISSKRDDYYIVSIVGRDNTLLQHALNANQDVTPEVLPSLSEKSLEDTPIKNEVKVTLRKRNGRNSYIFQPIHDSYTETTEEKIDVTVQSEQNLYLCRVKLINVVTPDEIYIVAANRIGSFNEIYKKMQSFYSKQKSTGSPDMSAGAMCAVRLPLNNAYYRAQIVERTEDNVKVFCVDEGKYETIPEDCIQSLAPELQAIPVYLYKTRLGGILPTCGMTTWSSVACERLCDIYTRNETRNFFVSKVENSKEKTMPVDLYVEEVKVSGPFSPLSREKVLINRLLVEEGLALPIKGYNNSKLQVLAAEVEKEMNCNDENLPDERHDDMNANVEASQTVDDFINDPSENMSEYFPPGIPKWLPAESIKKNTFSAIIRYIDWDAFVYLNAVDQLGALHKIEKTLADNYKDKPICETDEWSPGDMCIVKYHGSDKWCRGVVHQIRGDYIAVEFVDYGNLEWQERNTVFKEIMLENVPRMATKCQIRGLISSSPNGRWSAAELITIHSTIIEKKCKVTVIERKADYNIIRIPSVDGIIGDLISYLHYDKKMNICLENVDSDSDSDVDSKSSVEINMTLVEKIRNNGDSIASISIIDDNTNGNAKYDSELNDNIDNPIECLDTIKSISGSSDVDDNVKNTVGTIVETIPSNQCFIIKENSEESETKSNSNEDYEDYHGDVDEEYLENDEKIVQASLPDYYRSVLKDFQMPKNDGKYVPLILPDYIKKFEGAIGEIDRNQSNIVWLHPRQTTESSILNHHRSAYDKLQKEINEEVDELPYLEFVDPGTPCVAPYEGGWYRAAIVSPVILGVTIEVFYVDWGNIEEVEVSQLRVMKKEWLDLPKLAIKCRLWNTLPSDNTRARNWLEFKRKKAEKMYRIEIVVRAFDQFIVKIFEKDGDNRLMYQDLIDRKIFLNNLNDFYNETISKRAEQLKLTN